MNFTIKANWVVLSLKCGKKIYHSAEDGPALGNNFAGVLKANCSSFLVQWRLLDQEASSVLVTCSFLLLTYLNSI